MNTYSAFLGFSSLIFLISFSSCGSGTIYPNENMFDIDNQCSQDEECSIVSRSIRCDYCSSCSDDKLNDYVAVNHENYDVFMREYQLEQCPGYLECIESSDSSCAFNNACPECFAIPENESINLEARCVDNLCSKWGEEGH